MQSLKKSYIHDKENVKGIKELYSKPKTNINNFIINKSTKIINKFHIESKPEFRNILIADVLPTLDPSLNLMKYDFYEEEIELRLMSFRKDKEDKLIYKKKNLRRIKKFLSDLKNLYFDKNDSYLEFPYIIPGPAHSIDVHWITNQYRLLINFPVDISDEITIAGHKKGRDVIKLSSNPNNTVKLLIQWLNIVMTKETL